jgi:hypothetical protein
MKFKTDLFEVNNFVIFGDTDGKCKEKQIREGFTGKDIGSIIGIDIQDGSAIRISRESWKRLEMFMALLSGAEMSISEKKLKDFLKEFDKGEKKNG